MPESNVYLNNANICFDYVVGSGDADEFDDAKYVVKEICPDWKDAANCEIDVKIIVGGITNRLYRLVWGSKSVLVRVYGDHTDKFIDRAVENTLFALLSKNGFAPTYYGRFTNGRVEGWLDARPLEPHEMGQTQPVNYLQMIGHELALMHLMDIPGDRTPLLWTKMRHFEKLALEIKLKDPEKNAALKKLNIASLHQKIEWLMSVLPSIQNAQGKEFLEDDDTDEITKQAVMFASDVVFSHNDLLSGNILHNPKWDRVQIIDYEYGGYNFRGFDFANHFCENCGFDLTLALYPSFEQQSAFFKAYMSTAAPEMLAQLTANRESKAFFRALYDVVNRYALASHLFWGFWALVQASHSKIDFDFLQNSRLGLTNISPQKVQYYCNHDVDSNQRVKWSF
ncbi:probable ethanolamine kinase a-like isoform 1 [Plasmopara halstedii]|uniref:ethanolamine kinase n=1 Tax=Plasmopara halstedii TaxID=4781 RepID=A0A0P1ABF7_PLAHL|nr:probable ethanolamine kinase a-like isoform 1 [Plasmopara halstedii]CEG38089.1 probable ethanolamine kinase a-like isoform 1 [Plasmopara halstedii]|eukprot:XP_024574458.1 probable ethanolamine kinase a-like isoform 1 [Plasmopara halstedii]